MRRHPIGTRAVVEEFASMRAGAEEGTVTTKPLQFTGNQLLLNYVVQPGGSLLIEALDDSESIVGRSKPLAGDVVDTPVQWEQAPDFDRDVVALRFSIKNASLYSLRFTER